MSSAEDGHSGSFVRLLSKRLPVKGQDRSIEALQVGLFLSLESGKHHVHGYPWIDFLQASL